MWFVPSNIILAIDRLIDRCHCGSATTCPRDRRRCHHTFTVRGYYYTTSLGCARKHTPRCRRGRRYYSVWSFLFDLRLLLRYVHWNLHRPEATLPFDPLLKALTSIDCRIDPDRWTFSLFRVKSHRIQARGREVSCFYYVVFPAEVEKKRNRLWLKIIPRNFFTGTFSLFKKQQATRTVFEKKPEYSRLRTATFRTIQTSSGDCRFFRRSACLRPVPSPSPRPHWEPTIHTDLYYYILCTYIHT